MRTLSLALKGMFYLLVVALAAPLLWWLRSDAEENVEMFGDYDYDDDDEGEDVDHP